MLVQFQMALKKLGLSISTKVKTPQKRGGWKAAWTYRLIFISLMAALGAGHPDESRADFVTQLVSQLSQEEKAAILLNKVMEVPMTRTAEALFMPNDDYARRRVVSGLLKLRQGLNMKLGRGGLAMGLSEDDLLALSSPAEQILNSLDKVPTRPGVELTKLMNNPAHKIEVIGLSSDVETVMPLLVKVPAGILPPGSKLSLMTPVVLSPEAKGTQHMVVTDASLLLSKGDGSSVYLLKAYCLDEAATSLRSFLLH